MSKYLLLALLLIPLRLEAQTVSADQVYLNGGPCQILSGTATPTGSVSGSTCDTYIQNSSLIWSKASGSNTTSGWVALPRTDLANTWTAAQTFNAGLTSTTGNFTAGLTSTTGTFTSTLIGTTGSFSGGLSATTGFFSSTLHATGNFDVGAVGSPQFTVTAANGNTAILGTLGVTGATTLNSTLGVTGTSNLGALNAGQTIIAGDLFPDVTDTRNFGRPDRLWNQGYLAQLNAILFALTTETLFGGYSTIGKNAGSLTASVTSGATSVNFGQTLTVGDWILIRAQDTAGAYTAEYMQVGTLVSGTTYNVSRNLSGLGLKNWAAGVPYLVLGHSGDGRIDLLAFDGKPRILSVAQGSTYNTQVVNTISGNMNSYYGYAADTYGFAAGAEGATNITMDATNGFRIKNGATNTVFKADISGNLTLGGNFTLITNPVSGVGGFMHTASATSLSAGTGWWLDYNNGFRVGAYPSGDYVLFDGTNILMKSANFTVDPTSGVRLTIPPGGVLPAGGSSYGFTGGGLSGGMNGIVGTSSSFVSVIVTASGPSPSVELQTGTAGSLGRL